MESKKNKQKIAIVIQRYGKQINGGAEVHAKLIAEQLCKFYDVTVLTSCAVDYKRWLPTLPIGISKEDDITVVRFENETRNPKKLRYYQKKISGKLLVQKLYKKFNNPQWMSKIFSSLKNNEEEDHLGWLTAQGPAMPGLIKYLKENGSKYSAFIFFTAIYYPTALGILQVAKKSILIPTLHDELISYFPGYKKTMAAAQYIFFNTLAEQNLAEKIFSQLTPNKKIVAVGINLHPQIENVNVVLEKYNITKPYLIYVGRIDEGKGCKMLVEYFLKTVDEYKLSLTLVMVGKINMPIVNNSSIIYTDFVDNESKIALMQQATALVIPSEFESLSLVLLESFGCGVPAIANENSEVLKNHINKSNGGWCFKTYDEFKVIILDILKPSNENATKGNNGFNYVAQNYSWQSVINKFKEAINTIEANN